MIAPWLCLAALAIGGCERLPSKPAVTSQSQARGITLVDWTASGYAGQSAAAALDALAATRANRVVILVTGYQGDPEAGLVRDNDPRTPLPGAVRTAIARALSLRLRVSLKPHVDLDSGGWRGRIEPRDPRAWFASYCRFLIPWAELAESSGVDEFVVGTELAGTVRNEDHWRQAIQEVRNIYSGRLIYASSWDEAGKVPFWDDLDLIGIDFYYPVASRRDPGRFEILAGWQPWLDRLQLLHQKTGKNILLTEIGYRSVDGAGMAPHEYAEDGVLDLGEQADLYWAAMEATGEKAWVAGLWWWNWPVAGTGGRWDKDYTPRGKPAALELTAAWKGGPYAAASLP